MIQKLLSLSVFLFCLSACGQEAPSTKNAVEVGEKEWKKAESGKASDELAANAIPDSDVVGKVKYSLTALQEEYKKADGVVPGIGKVTLLLDENLTLIIKNEFQGKTYETRADLKSLDPETSHIGVIVDQNPGEFPGIQIPVLAGKSKVLKMEDGKVKSKEDFLEIKLADRPGIERIAAAMMNAIQSAHGKI
jgi:hypothetical protein